MIYTKKPTFSPDGLSVVCCRGSNRRRGLLSGAAVQRKEAGRQFEEARC